MAIPATTGNLVSSLSDMQIGDVIPCRYTATSGAVGTFSELGTCTATEIPVVGSATPDGLFYFVKVDGTKDGKGGMLIADRVVQHSISYDVLNAGKFIEGKTGAISSVPTGKIRSLSCGNSYVDSNGNSSSTNSSLGSFPVNNEYDTIIRLSNLNKKITAGDNAVWNWSGIASWGQETPIIAIGASSNRVNRGNNTLVNWSQIVSSTANATIGFRPVLEYKEQ